MRMILLVALCLSALASCGDIRNPPRDEVIDTPDLILMLKEGDFDSITGIIEEYQSIYEADPARELYAVVPYRQFIDASYSTEDRPLIEARLEEWEHHSKVSFAPYMAMCSYSYGLSSGARGKARSMALVDMRLHCKHALKLNSRLPYAYGRLIKAGRMDRNPREIERWLRRGLSSSPASYFVRSAYQSILSPQHGGGNDEMLAFANQAQRHIDKNPMLVRLLSDAHDNIGNQHFRKDEYQKAILSYKKSYEFYAWSNPLTSLAAIYSTTGENDLAIEALTRAMEVNDSFYLFKRRARVYSDAGRFEEAIADINIALEDEPENPVFIRTKANILYKMEDYVAALAGYERLVSMWSGNAWDWRQIAYIKHRKIIDIEAAEKSYVRALAMESDSAWTWHEFATLLYNKKDPRAPAAFQTYLNLCAADMDCDPVMVDRSKKFVDCVNNEPECILKVEEYSEWLPSA